MKALIAVAIVLTAAGADAQTLLQQFPSCDLRAQRALKGEMGGAIKDPRQAHILMRADIVQADLGNAAKAGRITRTAGNGLFKRVQTVRTGADRYTGKQGFLSAAEAASYDRSLDDVAMRICRP